VKSTVVIKYIHCFLVFGQEGEKCFKIHYYWHGLDSVISQPKCVEYSQQFTVTLLFISLENFSHEVHKGGKNAQDMRGVGKLRYLFLTFCHAESRGQGTLKSS